MMMETCGDDEEETKYGYNRQKPICRVCLSTENVMKNAVEFQKYFMKLSDIDVTLDDCLPKWICIECIAQMKKATQFVSKIALSHSVLFSLVLRSHTSYIDPEAPELMKYKCPLLSATETLHFDNYHEKIGYHSVLQQRKQMYNLELLPIYEAPSSAFASDETTLSEDDPLENYKNTRNIKTVIKEDTGEVSEEEASDEEVYEEDSEDSDVSEKSEPKVIKKRNKARKAKLVAKIEKYSIPDVDVPWTSDKDRCLIEFVRQNEPLYNPKHDLYKIAALKHKLWRDAAQLMDKTDTDCYKRWCYVRDYYIRRRGKARCGEAAKKRAQLLSFLDHVPSPQRSWVPSERDEERQEDETEDVKMESLPVANVEPDPWEGIRIGEQYSKNASWDNELDCALIELVRRRPSLYNTRCKEYRQARRKQALWTEVARSLGKTESACYKRWCYVRDYYVRRKSNPGALSSGKAARARAARLAFLDLVHRSTTPKMKESPACPTEGTSSASLPGYTALRYRLGGYSKRSSEASWTSEHDEALIALVRRQPVLYNPRSKHFRSARMKHALWTQIAQTLNRTETDCCRRWSYIRDYYVRRRNKPGALSAGAAARRRAKALAFLDELSHTQEKEEILDEDENNENEQVDNSDHGVQDNMIPEIVQTPWTSEDDAMLIDFVKQNRALYNPKNRNAELKIKLWSDIGSILNRTDSDCYKRWCYVRDYYTRRKGRGGGEAAKRRAMLLCFLDRLPSMQRNK